MDLTAAEAEQLAVEFLVEDLEVPEDDQEYFAALTSRQVGSDWYVVEVGVEGLPDKWVIQVYDSRECDPCYTFVSPVAKGEEDFDLVDFPERIAEIIAAERQGGHG